ncbi:methionine ABC transporter ATP-binding protein [Citricoccus zhacaiensis]|uniref:methionine ABC transporter ATP-binding protein n=1 Tax=Citricoccus sp. I39-566 TaxID=3073268 RepID=UPI00286A9006|nr:ATP-binding cassette domain-containing protein [Citricoccus sp. I39-566]WMY78614.1 ATP-binding cassette domain-containing protein [Citricoccus sp. I39-566]
MIEIRDLHQAYTGRGGTVEVLKGIDLTVPEGSITAVVGPSGAGKTTLSHCISLLEKPTRGEILVDGSDLSRLRGRQLRSARRAIGTIFQHSALLRRITVAENVALPLRNLGVVHHEMQDRVAELLDRVGLLHKADSYPGQLSGGQRQRVGIARALALRPRILLSDESTSGLDPDTTAQILALLADLRTDLGLSIILITHEMDVVRNVADQVASLSHGRLAEYGSLPSLVADQDSTVGGQLLPIAALPLPAGFDTFLDLAYRDGDVDPEWFTRVAVDHQIRLALLGGTIEARGATALGRAVVGVRSEQAQRAIGALNGLGLSARLRSDAGRSGPAGTAISAASPDRAGPPPSGATQIPAGATAGATA